MLFNIFIAAILMALTTAIHAGGMMLSILFIDVIGRPLTPVSVAGAVRRDRRRTRRVIRRSRF